MHPLDNAGDGECLAAAGDAKERLMAIAPLKPPDEPLNSLRLVASGLEIGDNLKGWHGTALINIVCKDSYCLVMKSIRLLLEG